MAQRLPPKYLGYLQGLFGYLIGLILLWGIALFSVGGFTPHKALFASAVVLAALMATLISLRFINNIGTSEVQVLFWSGFVSTLIGAVMTGPLFSIIIFLFIGGYVFLQGILTPKEMISRSVMVCLAFLACGIYLHRNDADQLGRVVVAVVILQSLLISIAMHGGNFLRYKHRNKESKAHIERQNQQLQSLSQQLAKYLSPQIYAKLFTQSGPVQLQSTRKKLTIFFSDIQGFTAFTDRTAPEEVTQFLNRYLNSMAEIALKHGGTIDKYVGDSIMVFFGDPETKGERQDGLACTRMALEMAASAKEIMAQYPSHELHVRMGINSGFCTVGNFGSESRMDYTLVGSAVNLAARMEQLAGEDEIWLTEETYSLVAQSVLVEPKGTQEIKGMRDPVSAYKLLGQHDADSDEPAQTIEQIMALATDAKLNPEQLQRLEERLRKMARSHQQQD